MNTSSLRTEVDWKYDGPKVTPRDLLVFQGSCFSEHIGKYLVSNKFQCSAQDLGTTFHPISLLNSLRTSPQKERLCERDGLFFHLDFSSKFFDVSSKDLLLTLENYRTSFIEKLRKCSFFFWTLGTAQVYKTKDGREVVNCHKQSPLLFEKERSSVENLTIGMIEFIQNFCPQATVILTVSPVRHTKEGFSGNSRSKASLLLAAEACERQFENVYYFPMYEFFVDELRAYRFFEADGIHPNMLGLTLAKERFVNNLLDPSSQNLIRDWSLIEKRLTHSPLHPKATSYVSFLENTLLLLEKFQNTYAIDCSDEFLDIQKRLSGI